MGNEMSWPTPQDYNEAVQLPSTSFVDPDLKQGEAELDILGLPRPISGAFASVYHIKGARRDFAVRCFLRAFDNQRYRYHEIGNWLRQASFPEAVPFEYIDEGIKIRDQMYPILKMEWVAGKSLEQFVDEHTSNQHLLHQVADYFRRMTRGLRDRGIAHGDLQHGNILVINQGFKLVDYDGTFVPGFKGQMSNELGHPNYQHPMRNAEHFGPTIDNFSSWVIYSSLACLSVDPSLWQRLGGGDECLLFRQSDFATPLRSLAFSLLEYHASDYIRTIGRVVRTLLRCKPDQVPNLDEPIAPAEDLPLLPQPGEITSARERAREIHSSAVDFAAASATWPKPEAYQESAKQPTMSFKDRELRRAQYTFEFSQGKHGIVLHFKAQHRHLAVKCFFRDNPERETRYNAIKNIISGNAKNYFADFEYQREGIFAAGRWFPILKMDWVQGTTLEKHLWSMQQLWVAGQSETEAMQKQQSAKAQQTIDTALSRFRGMMQALYSAGIAHGDLSHSNIFVTPQGMKLVDYDNMYVPALAGLQSQEFGEPVFQHPGRTLNHFGPYLDNYSAWVIDNAITFLSLYPDAFHWQWDDIVQLARSDLCFTAQSIVPPHSRRGQTWPIRPEMRRRAHLMRMLEQFPVEYVPPLVADFGSNVLKREALVAEVEKMLRKYTSQ
jgi:tRNA A-37 threonylcarbamoyl transferase component Bud32